MAGEPSRKRLVVTGQVQGVGFRPFAYRLACDLDLTGWVRNDSRGVTIEVQGPPARLALFASRLRRDLPPLARIESCDEQDVQPLAGEDRFEIHPSQDQELSDAQVTVDVAVCEDCLREMNDPADRRHGYVFINCTNCGPRYSIVRRIPYDRPNTTMADFAMCPACAQEYSDPADRRFHAQPIACERCGPSV
jgi:hydrogenase maturation protein HypF